MHPLFIKCDYNYNVITFELINNHKMHVIKETCL